MSLEQDEPQFEPVEPENASREDESGDDSNVEKEG